MFPLSGSVLWRLSQLFSEVWAIVTELQGKVASSLEAEAGRAEEESSATWCEPLVSTLLVAPRLHPFNSALFENLARNVDIALKQTPIMDRVEVEVRWVRGANMYQYWT